MRTMKAVSRIYSAAHLTVSICDSFHQICKKIARSDDLSKFRGKMTEKITALQNVAGSHVSLLWFLTKPKIIFIIIAIGGKLKAHLLHKI